MWCNEYTVYIIIWDNDRLNISLQNVPVWCAPVPDSITELCHTLDKDEKKRGFSYTYLPTYQVLIAASCGRNSSKPLR